jgi:protein-tyrosine-phosphatase
MEKDQKAAILEMYPNLKGRVFTVRGFGEKEPNVPVADIPDPTGREAEDFQAFLNVARSAAERVLHLLWTEGLPQSER